MAVQLMPSKNTPERDPGTLPVTMLRLSVLSDLCESTLSSLCRRRIRLLAPILHSFLCAQPSLCISAAPPTKGRVCFLLAVGWASEMLTDVISARACNTLCCGACRLFYTSPCPSPRFSIEHSKNRANPAAAAWSQATQTHKRKYMIILCHWVLVCFVMQWKLTDTASKWNMVMGGDPLSFSSAYPTWGWTAAATEPTEITQIYSH